jgi:hypothetical protein
MRGLHLNKQEKASFTKKENDAENIKTQENSKAHLK